MIIGTFARLFRLGSQSIWGDESLTLLKYTTGNSFAEVWGHIWHAAVHPPLYFMIAHYWYLLGKSEFMLRFPSALFGIICIPVMYALTNRLFGRATASISALVVALSPIAIWYSQEARMYNLQILLGLLATLYFVKLWRERRAVDGVLYVLFLVAGLFTHMATLSLVAGHGLFAVLASIKTPKRLAVWVGIYLLVIAAFSPWLMNMVHTRQHSTGGVHLGYERPTSITDIGYGFYTFCVGYSVGPSVAELHERVGLAALKPYMLLIVLIVLVFGCLAILGLVRSRKYNPGAFLLLLTLLLVPAALAGLASLLPRIPLNPRYMLVSVIPFWILLALGIQSALQRPAFRVLPVAVLLLTGLAVSNYYFQPKYWKQDVRSAVAVVDHNARPGDVIIISSIELGGPFIYYHDKNGVPYFGYPSRTGRIDSRKMSGDIAYMIYGKKRVWLILGRTWSSDPEDLLKHYFHARALPIESRSFPGVELFCYSPHTLNTHASKPQLD